MFARKSDFACVADSATILGLLERGLGAVALAVDAVERAAGECRDRAEREDAEHDRDGEADLDVEAPRAIAEERQPAEQHGDEYRRREQAAREHAARLVADQERDDAALGARGDRREAEEQERDRGRQRHRLVAAQAVERGDAIGVADQRDQCERGRHDEDPRRRLRAKERDADRREREGGVRRDAIRPEAFTEEDLVEPRVETERIGDDGDAADEGDERGERLGEATADGRDRAVAKELRRRRGDEQHRRRRVHRRASRHEALEERDVELPADERETGERDHERARALRKTAEPGPRHPSRSLASRRMSHACTRDRTCAGRNGFVR